MKQLQHQVQLLDMIQEPSIIEQDLKLPSGIVGLKKLQLPLKVKRGKLGSSTIVAIAKLLLRRYFVVEHDVDTRMMHALSRSQELTNR